MAGGAVLAHGLPAVAVLGQWAPVRRLPGMVWRGPDTRPRVALTFDDGPSSSTTPPLLDRLASLEVRATFFWLGSEVARHPDAALAVVAAGHQVELHGHEHAHHLLRPPRWVGRDLDRGLAALRSAGVRPSWWRPTYGQLSGPSLVAARQRRLRVALWSCWGREWRAPDAGSVAGRVAPGLRPGGIVLLHDSDAASPPGTAQRALGAVAPIVTHARRHGLQPVTLDELLDHPERADKRPLLPPQKF